VDEVICVESFERAFSKEAGDEWSRAKGQREGIMLCQVRALHRAVKAPHASAFQLHITQHQYALIKMVLVPKTENWGTICP
jgi:hypothetical protein